MTPWILLANATVLGIRHGIDWDHIAAVVDIVGTTTSGPFGVGFGRQWCRQSNLEGSFDRTGSISNTGISSGLWEPLEVNASPRSGVVLTSERFSPAAIKCPLVAYRDHGPGKRPGDSQGVSLGFAEIRGKAVFLCGLYAVGHSLVVIVLGLSAMLFVMSLPGWIDQVMERVVGVSLLLLGSWLLFSIGRYARGADDFKMQSRWMMLLLFLEQSVSVLFNRLVGRSGSRKILPERYGPGAALLIGMIHGVGAETGTQVLLIASVSGGSSIGLGIGMLMAFTVGFVLSNTIIAIIAVTGFLSSARMKPLYLATGMLTALLSLVIGTGFVFGRSDLLPDLGKPF